MFPVRSHLAFKANDSSYVFKILIYFDFTAATAADRPALSARAGWKKKRRNRLQNTVGAWTLEMESVCIVRVKDGNEMVF